MDEINENAWIENRELEIEAMWNTSLPPSEGEITENEIPY